MVSRNLSSILNKAMENEGTNNQSLAALTNCPVVRHELDSFAKDVANQAICDEAETLTDVYEFKMKNSALPIKEPFKHFSVSLADIFDQYKPDELKELKNPKELTVFLYTFLVHAYATKIAKQEEEEDGGYRLEIIEQISSMLLSAKTVKELKAVYKCSSNDQQVITVDESRKRMKVLMDKFVKKIKTDDANDETDANTLTVDDKEEIDLTKYESDRTRFFKDHFKILPQSTVELFISLMDMNDFMNSFTSAKDAVISDATMSKIKLKEDTDALKIKFSKPILIPLDLVSVKDNSIEMLNARQREFEQFMKIITTQLDCGTTVLANNCHPSVYVAKLKSMAVVKVNEQFRDGGFNVGLLESSDVKFKQVVVFVNSIYITSSLMDLKQKHSLRLYPMRLPHMASSNSNQVVAALNFYNPSIVEDRISV